jgi:hypothetical protein
LGPIPNPQSPYSATTIYINPTYLKYFYSLRNIN